MRRVSHGPFGETSDSRGRAPAILAAHLVPSGYDVYLFGAQVIVMSL